MGKYNVGSKWKHQSDWKKTVFYRIDTRVGRENLGIFLITKWTYDQNKLFLQEGNDFPFTTYKYDIIAWNPL
jgi:hypothetical protein